MRSQFATSSSNKHGGRRYMPYVFAEQGIAMLSAVLKSEVAVEVSVKIMKNRLSKVILIIMRINKKCFKAFFILGTIKYFDNNKMKYHNS